MTEEEQARELEELLAAWALDAVSPAERARVESAIASDPGIAAHARELVETVAQLAEASAVAPPPELRASVLAAAAAERAPRPAPRPDRSPDRRAARPAPSARARLLRTLALAACAALAIAVPTTFAVQQAHRADTASSQLAAVTDALASPGARLVAGDVTGGGQAVAVVTDDAILVTAAGLPDLGSDRSYQLWLLDGDEITSVGLLAVADGRAQLATDAPPGAAIAVSIEPAGGSRQPTTDPVVVLAAS